jgi:membrane-associated protein
VFDRIVNTLSGSAWTYLIVAVVSAMDAIFPVVPADAAIITAAVLAAQGSLSSVLVVGAGLVGATAGDNVSYYLGARLGSRAARRLFRGATARARLDWARDQVGRRGVTLVVAARFIPGGRTAATFAAGTLHLRWRRFLVADLVGAFGWAALTAMIGYLGGQAFGQRLWPPLLISLGVAGLIVLGAEIWQHVRARSKPDRQNAGSGGGQPTPVEQAFMRLQAAEGTSSNEPRGTPMEGGNGFEGRP